MPRMIRPLVASPLLLVLALLPGARIEGATPDRPRTVSSLRSTLEDLPLYFVENRGQADPRVDYYLQGQDTSVFFTPGGVTFSLPGRGKTTGRWALRQEFVGAGPGVQPSGAHQAPTRVSYFKGQPGQWHTGLPTFSRVVYRDLWPGIDLAYSGSGSSLKYSFVVEPGADPGDIRVAWRGAAGLEVNALGQLEVESPAGTLTEDTPFSYQMTGDRRVQVPSSYTLGGDGAYGFDVEAYDPTRPLVIDPAVLVYAGYVGGARSDFGEGIAVDPSGAAYLTGSTGSTGATFPVAVGPDLTHNGDVDAFVAKVSPSGASLEYTGYVGGREGDSGGGIAVDSSGAAYLTGVTSSSQATFPVAVGPDLTYNGGDADAFVAKVSPSGASLEYAGYVGGSGSELGQGIDIAVDSSGAAYLTGVTSSSQATFPVAVGPDLTFNGDVDAFVAKVSSLGVSLEYAGYVGGSGSDFGEGIAVDPSGAAYLTGVTFSPEATFPVAVGPDLTFNGGDFDGFVAKVSPSGASLKYAGYVGGGEGESGRDIAVDSSGAAYMTGLTSSPEATFPVAVGPDLTHNGDFDAFVAKVSSSGASLEYSGYVGGSGSDFGDGIAVDSSGAAYMTGTTGSPEATFPVAVGPDLTYNGGAFDAFVAKVSPSGASLEYAGYVGGSGSLESGEGIAVDPSGAAYMTGTTGSREATFPVTVGPDLTYNGGDFDAFVAKVAARGTTAPQCPGLEGEPGNHIVGTPGDDTIRGTAGPDVICGLGGDDVLNGLGAGDMVVGGDGEDLVEGGDGDDALRGGAGTDLMRGGAGEDTVQGGEGSDDLRAGTGDDFLSGGAGDDFLDGGPGQDDCDGGPGVDTATGCEREQSIP